MTTLTDCTLTDLLRETHTRLERLQTGSPRDLSLKIIPDGVLIQRGRRGTTVSANHLGRVADGADPVGTLIREGWA